MARVGKLQRYRDNRRARCLIEPGKVLYDEQLDALEAARWAALDGDLVLVCGSAYLIGAINEVSSVGDGSSW